MVDETKVSEEETKVDTDPGDSSDPKKVEVELKKEEEPRVPLSRLRKEISKRKDAEIKAQPEKDALKDLMKQTLAEVQKEQSEQTVKDEQQLKEDLVGLHKIHGEFDDKKLLELVNEYGVYGIDGNVNWDKSVELYKRLAKAPSAESVKPKMPSSLKTGDSPQKEVYKTEGKSLYDIAEESKKEIG